ncbi:serine hydrolase [Spirulina subsalsa FACHB-351]|uniref:Serine hydrolase n=1 Tax=Spirulina subsalsa FACHB-351 TaxID=234711 RepID=A0ABT3L6C4_9CYAN|nr:serine hydrolase [Spirulina subsalsa]MCW6037061.1 serine hydrolase [Spirulina subsalsa FACHB-351]
MPSDGSSEKKREKLDLALPFGGLNPTPPPPAPSPPSPIPPHLSLPKTSPENQGGYTQPPKPGRQSLRDVSLPSRPPQDAPVSRPNPPRPARLPRPPQDAHISRLGPARSASPRPASVNPKLPSTKRRKSQGQPPAKTRRPQGQPTRLQQTTELQGAFPVGSQLSDAPRPRGAGSKNQDLLRPVGAKSAPTLSSLLLVYSLRVLILGVGSGAIAGTILGTVDASRNLPFLTPSPTTSQAVRDRGDQGRYPPALAANREITPLKNRLQSLISRHSEFEAGVFFMDLDTGDYVDIQGNKPFAAASTIKTPILIAFFQALDAGSVSLTETLVMEEDTLAGEAGDMQYQPLGTRFSALDTVTRMITISDNTATNMIMKRLGGQDILNQRFTEWGLSATMIHNLLPDVEGTNTTSAVDLAHVMARVNRGDLVNLRSRDRLLEIMRNVQNNQLLPQGLDNGAIIAHKTGNIGSVVADAGLIDTPTGRRYLAAVIIQRPHNDPKATDLIRDISREAYQYFNQPVPTPDTTMAPLERDSIAVQPGG